MAFGIFITSLLVFLNGFFVAAEFAIVKIRVSRLDIKISSGSRVAGLAKDIVEHLEAYLSACQLGITLASLALGWIGEKVFARTIETIFSVIGLPLGPEMSHAIALPTAFVLLTMLHIVIGEQGPKVLAIKHPEVTTLWVALPLRLFYLIFKPFIWLLNTMANALLRALGLESSEAGEIHSEDELRLLIAQSYAGGAIQSSEHELIEKVFAFDERVVKQIMIPRVRICALDEELSGDEIFEAVLKEGYSRFPVYSGSADHITGIVHARDIFRLKQKNEPIALRTIIRPAYVVPPNKKISDLLREFQKKRVHVAIVVDEFGVTSGLVTLEDIVEELVGEIQDEYDEEAPAVEKRGEDEYVIRGTVPIVDANQLLPVPIPESPEYSTVAGYMNTEFGLLPDVGSSKALGAYEYTILKRSRRRIELVKLKLLPQPAEAVE